MVAKKTASQKKEETKTNKTKDRIYAGLFASILCLAILTIAAVLSLFALKVLKYTEQSKRSMPVVIEEEPEELYWERIVSLHPTYFPSWVALSEIYYKKGQRSKAEEAYWRAWKLDPNSKEVKVLEDMLYGE